MSKKIKRWKKEEMDKLKSLINSLTNTEIANMFNVSPQQIASILYYYKIKRKKKTSEQKFWEKVDKKEEDECWEWKACKDTCGYGIIWYNKKNTKTHRFSWILHYGKIPKGTEVCHHCDNPPCVNPKHLWMGTHRSNMLDMRAKNRGSITKGEKNGSHKLTENDVINIRNKYKMKKYTITKLSKQYEMCWNTIYYIVNRKLWKHI